MTAPVDLMLPAGLVPSQLTGDQLDALRSLLTDALVEHRWQIEQNEALVASLTVEAAEEDTAQDRELSHAASIRARASIDDVTHALARLDDGTYGSCEVCGRTIPYERLEAIPEASHCVACLRQGGTVR